GPKIETRLLDSDHRRFQKLVSERDSTMAQVGRDAILFYLAHVEVENLAERESFLESRMSDMESRITNLLTQATIDTGVVLHLLYAAMNPDTRDEEIQFADRQTKARINRKLESRTLGDRNIPGSDIR